MDDSITDTDVATHWQRSLTEPFVIDHCWAVVTVDIFDVAPFDITITAGDLGSPLSFSFTTAVEKTLHSSRYRNVTLDSYVVSVTPYAAGRQIFGGMARDKLEEKHILFQPDDREYIKKIFGPAQV